MNATRRSTRPVLLLALLFAGCAVYKTTDEDRFPCGSDSDCYDKQPSCQPAYYPNGDKGTFCSACNANAAFNEYELCTGDSDCRCPMQCLRGPASTDSQPEFRCFYPCTASLDCLNTQTCNLDHDGICVAFP